MMQKKLRLCLLFIGMVFSLICSGPVAAQEVSLGDVESLLEKTPDPFAEINMNEVVSRYGDAGSGVSIIREAITISGTTGIVKDSSGFGFTVLLSGDYLFEFDKSAITPEADEVLSEILELYHENDGKDITIEGHTDSKGSVEYNNSLSERRAKAVLAWFAQQGVDPQQMRTKWYGETRPVAKNQIDGKDNPEGRALNRRVEIHITTLKKVNSLPLVK